MSAHGLIFTTTNLPPRLSRPTCHMKHGVVDTHHLHHIYPATKISITCTMQSMILCESFYQHNEITHSNAPQQTPHILAHIRVQDACLWEKKGRVHPKNIEGVCFPSNSYFENNTIQHTIPKQHIRSV
ncbi:hypothetical protein D1007_06703 [Hordeum vulgare]|nr:hypothetical protein D1007_06703 [Hordeum vulgare]